MNTFLKKLKNFISKKHSEQLENNNCSEYDKSNCIKKSIFSSYEILFIIPLQLYLLIKNFDINFEVFFKFGVLNFYIFLFFKIFEKKNINYGLVILYLIGSILFLSFLGFKFFILLTFFLYFSFLKNTDWKNFLYKKLINKIIILFLVCIPVSFFIISLQNRGYGSFYVDRLMTSGRIHQDQLFHISISNMIKNYFIPSTGVHGLKYLHYHWFSNLFYGFISKLLNMQTYYVYGFLTFLTLTPLFFLSISELSEQIDKSKNILNFFVKWCLIIFVFMGFSTLGKLPIYGIWIQSFFISESFILGNILFLSFISFLFEVKNKKKYESFFCFVFLFFLWISKVSFGVVSSVLVFLKIFFSKNFKLNKKILLLLILFFISFMFVKITHSNSEGDSKLSFDIFTKYPYFFNNYIKNPYKLSKSFNFIYFILFHFYFFFLSSLIFLFSFLNGRKFLKKTLNLFILNVMFFLIVLPFLFLPIAGGSGLYFTGISFIFSVFLITLLKNSFFLSFRFNPIKMKNISFFLKRNLLFFIIFFIGLFGFFEFGFLYLKNNYKTYFETNYKLKSNNELKYYFNLFEKIKQDENINSFIYIPKSENIYWNSLRNLNISFFSQAISERPALFGMYYSPDIIRSDTKDNIFNYYGMRYYQDIFEKANKAIINYQSLKKEGSNFNFEKILIIQNKEVEEFLLHE